MHNLKKIDVAIPRNNFVVVTGLSGSGKSSLAFDTLYAEGQRRYVESLSAYARQFVGRMDKPEVEYIRGIAPAIAIEQKVNTRNPRSTVGTSTEIYDYLKLLFARVGRTYAPGSGKLVQKHASQDVVDFIYSLGKDAKVFIYAPMQPHKGRKIKEELGILLQKGFSRVSFMGVPCRIDELAEDADNLKKFRKQTGDPAKDVLVLIDRLIIDPDDDDQRTRVTDSVNSAFNEGDHACLVEVQQEGTRGGKKGKNGKDQFHVFTNRFEEDGMSFEEPSVNLFSFNNPYGACKNCEGFGSIIGIDPDLVVPDKSLSVYDNAIAPWRGEKMGKWRDKLVKHAYKFNFPIHRPYFELNDYERGLLWKGNKYFEGLDDFFAHVEEQTYKIQYRVMLSRYRGKTTCPECGGTRLRKDAGYVRVGGKSITDIVLMQVRDSFAFFEKLKLDGHEVKIATRLLTEIRNRLRFMTDVGLGYLTLNRLSNTLSGGESQRINLATSLGSSLVGSMYILDEPSIGLHPRDTERLIGVLKSLQKLGNTLVVVEHDEAIMRSADELIDIGPEAGTNGGHLVFQGKVEDLVKEEDSYTARYLTGKEIIHVPSRRRKWKNSVQITGATEHNLKNIDVAFPLGVLTCVTGVSGSGKTSLVKGILFPAIRKRLGGYSEQTGSFGRLEGDYERLTGAELVDQNPIGKSSRSNPVTYIKAFDEIRALFSETPYARSRRFKPGHFSFNMDGGRCEVCQGEGQVTIEMQFMADLHLKCESCHGRRFKDEVLLCEFREKSIADILEMTVDDAMTFFNNETLTKFHALEQKVLAKLKPLQDVGLGYVRLGQASSTLSGGEAQRIKLASFIGKGTSVGETMFVFDEPTTGLHFHDIRKLLDAFTMLINKGHTVVVIEHNLDVIKCADWIVDLGPGGGDMGGELLFAGTPEDLVKEKKSVTGKFLKGKLK